MARKFLVLLLIFTVLLAICGCGKSRQENPVTQPPTEAPTQPEIILTLEDLGGSEVRGAVKLTNMGFVNGDPSFVKGGILIDSLNEKVKLLDLNGNPKTSADYDNIEHIFPNGICAVSNRDSFGVNQIGLVDSISGKELVPCEAVELQILSDRYLLLSYLEELTNSWSDYYGSFYRNENKLYYTGYGMIYDLEECRFVPDFQQNNSKKRITVLDSLLFEETKEYSVKNVYDPNGQLLGSYINLYSFPHSGIALQVLRDGIQVYDAQLEKVSLLPGTIYEYDSVAGGENMLIKSETGDEESYVYVIDLQGKRLSENCRAISAIFDGKYLCHSIVTEEGEMLYGIRDFKGKDIVPAQYTSIQYMQPGYFLAATAEGFFAYQTDGTLCNQEPLSHHGGSPVLYQEVYEKLFILEKDSFYEAEQYPDYQCLSLMYVDGMVIDVITGETVMDYVDDCMSAGNNLYIWDSDSQCYTRYLVEYALPTES